MIELSEKAKAFGGIPEYMHGGLIRYFEKGIPPGHFLTAVLDNDLRGAFERADESNAAAIHDYVRWLYNYAPSGSWGYKGAVADWCLPERIEVKT